MMFKEKPTQEVAKDYIAKGALWNGGVFAFKLGYVLNRAHELIDFVDYDDLFNKYDTLNKISFDYVVHVRAQQADGLEKMLIMNFLPAAAAAASMVSMLCTSSALSTVES